MAETASQSTRGASVPARPVQPSMQRRHRVGIAIAFAGIFAVAVAYAVVLYAPCDDTYIYLVYVKNLLGGHGLTFNGTKVQGFTSVLWTGVLALGGLLPWELPSVANVLSAVAGVFAIVASFVLARRTGLPTGVALIPPVLLAFTGDFAFYMSNGLETMIFTALLAMSLTFLFTDDARGTLRSLRLPAVLALTAFARPEGALTGSLIVLVLWIRSRDRRAMLKCAGTILLMAMPVLVGARIYYGDWLPNTYYAKSGAGLSNVDQGLQYLVNFVDGQIVTVAVLGYFVLIRPRALGAAVIPLILVLIVWTVHITIQGGDNMVGARALVPMLPIVYLLVARGLVHTRRRHLVAVVIGIVVFGVWKYNFGNAHGSSWDVPIKRQTDNWHRFHEYRRAIGVYLNEHTEPDAIIALNDAGAIPYYAERPTIDMLGLNDKHIARRGKRDRSLIYGHQAGDGMYVLRQKPYVILFGGAGAPQGDQFLSEREIFTIREFRRYYDARRLPMGRRGYFRNTPPEKMRVN